MDRLTLVAAARNTGIGLENLRQRLNLLYGSRASLITHSDERCHLIEVSRIHYLESCKNYTRLFFDNDKGFVKKSLNQLEARLPQRLFFRANRQAIINLEAIAGIAEAVGEGYEVTLSDGRLVEVSRRNATRLKALLSL